MKNKFFSVLLLTAAISPTLQAQIDIGGKIKDKLNQKAENALDKAIESPGKKKNQSGDNTAPQNNDQEKNTTSSGNTGTSNVPSKKADLISYSKYDFIPGDKIIFEDHVEDEKTGEFPSKWDLANGSIEVAVMNGESVITLIEGNYASIAPLMASQGDYLPDVFTIEFDSYFPEGGAESIDFLFYNEKDYNYDELIDLIAWNRIGKYSYINAANGSYPEGNGEFGGKWHHMAISYNKGNIKFYIDQYRVLNIPKVNGNPQGLTLGAIATKESPVFLKNIRIASGGGDLYKRVATEGKIITHGILFDTGKSTIRPQSMGTLNEIAAILKKDPSLKFRIDGHTDSDGDDAANLKLSQERADAVKAELVKLGIDASRLTTKGWGETKPMDTSETPEGKANNRRVEFVKL